MQSILILILLSFFQLASAQQIWQYEDNTYQYELTVDSLLMGGVYYESMINSIVIKRKSDLTIIDRLNTPENGFSTTMPKEQVFIIEDINFDGYNDIRLLQFLPASPNIPYYYWTFNPATEKFERMLALEEITSPEFDARKKLIYSFWRASCCDHGLSTYQYINGKITLIEEVEIAQDLEHEGTYITTVKKLVKGEMKIVKKTIEKE